MPSGDSVYERGIIDQSTSLCWHILESTSPSTQTTTHKLRLPGKANRVVTCWISKLPARNATRAKLLCREQGKKASFKAGP